jgi:hypothetical protein
MKGRDRSSSTLLLETWKVASCALGCSCTIGYISNGPEIIIDLHKALPYFFLLTVVLLLCEYFLLYGVCSISDTFVCFSALICVKAGSVVSKSFHVFMVRTCGMSERILLY